MKKIILFLMMMLVLTSSAYAAHFVCGKVNDATDGTTASWRIAYVSMANRADKSECEVNPTERKYCCDLEDLATTWAIGNNIYAWIPDDGSGYFADEISSITTGAGYDVMPDMDLLGIITISGINSYYNVNHASGNINALSPYTSEIGYSLNGGGRTVLCNDCSSATISLANLSNDDHTLLAYAKDPLGNERTNSRLFNVFVPPPTTTTTTITTTTITSTTTTTLAVNDTTTTTTSTTTTIPSTSTTLTSSGKLGGSEQSLMGQLINPTVQGEYKVSFTSIVLGKTYIYDLHDDKSPLVHFDFVASNEIAQANINFNIIQSDGTTNQEGFTLYSSIDISTDLSRPDAAKVTYKIRIDKSWLAMHNADVSQISALNNNGESLLVTNVEDSGDYFYVSLLSNNIESLRIGIFEKGTNTPDEPYNELNMTAKERIKQPNPGKIPGGELIRREVMKQFYTEIIIFFAVVAIVSCISGLALIYHHKIGKKQDIKSKAKSMRLRKKKQKKVKR